MLTTKIYLPLSVGDIDSVADCFENNGKPLDKGKAAQHHSYMYRTEIRRSRCLKNKFFKFFFLPVAVDVLGGGELQV